MIRPQRGPFQDPGQFRRRKNPPSSVQHSGQLPETAGRFARNTACWKGSGLPYQPHTLFRAEAPLPCPSHTRFHPPEASGYPFLSLCPKREKKPRHEASLKEPRDRTPPTSFQPCASQRHSQLVLKTTFLPNHHP